MVGGWTGAGLRSLSCQMLLLFDGGELEAADCGAVVHKFAVLHRSHLHIGTLTHFLDLQLLHSLPILPEITEVFELRRPVAVHR